MSAAPIRGSSRNARNVGRSFSFRLDFFETNWYAFFDGKASEPQKSFQRQFIRIGIDQHGCKQFLNLAVSTKANVNGHFSS